MVNCVFCKIVAKEMRGLELYEDDLVMAILDTHPVSDGHLLVIPKKHYENVFVTPDDVLSRINQVCKKMALLCKEKIGATGANILNASGKDAQQSVFHLHFHVVPRFKEDGLDLWFHGESENLKEAKAIQKKLLDNKR